MQRPNVLPARTAPSQSAQNIPPGWSYNPSAWRERRPLIALAVVGLGAALYTTLSQLGVVPAMWDPFFGSASSYAVTHSALARLLPIPDGLLGVAGYVCDLVFGAIGGEDRWRRRPWAVLAFAIAIIGLGVVSLVLTIFQGTVIGQWCTVCLVSAAVSTLILGLGIGEALASLQYLGRVHIELGANATWHALWGTRGAWRLEPTDWMWMRGVATTRQDRLPDIGMLLQVIVIAVGIWLMAAPAVLPSTAPGAVMVRIAGPVVAWVGVLALRGVTRSFRALNIVSGMFLTIAPWSVPNTGPLILTSVLAGCAIIILTIPRGVVHQRTGGGWWATVHPELISHSLAD
ncbi:MAG: vitamin K epoxide reductase family protein [Nitrososphaerota archaeon]